MERRPILWRPFEEVERFRREFDRLLEEFLPVVRESEAPVFVPPVEVYETDKEVVIKVDLPGVSKEDVEITVKENAVTVRAERKEEREESATNVIRSERFYGVVERVIPLPVEVNPEEAKAEYKDGVLIIRVPKAQVEREKKIKPL
ncbi:MAG: Hsp20/alpha crystallin family protein [Aquificae bacterium]|nr:Hsp20/alpha crystallin family protein [Aquificota bacterium]